MGRAEYERIILKAKHRLVISGGEPILSGELMRVLSLAKKNKNLENVELQSNGAVLSYPHVVDKLQDCNIITEYNINFPSSEEKLDQLLTKTTFFKKRVLGIKNLLGKKLNVRLTFVINKSNYKHMQDYLNFIFIEFQNKPSVQFSFIQVQDKARLLNIVPSYKEIKKYLVGALDFAQRKDMCCFVDNVPLCVSFPYIHLNIDYLKLRGGDASFHKKKKVGICNGCELMNSCFGPPEDYVVLFGNEGLKPIKS